MLRATLALFALLVAFAMQRPATVQDEAPPIRIACVGDSITFGATIKERTKNCYPAQLQDLLGEAFAVQNFGVNGATMLKKGNKPYWTFEQFNAAQNLQPDIVIIKLGTNDTKPDNWKFKYDYQANYIEMIEAFRKLDSKPKVYLCYPAPVVAEKWGINDKTVREEVILMIDAIAKEMKLPIIDLYTPLKDKPELLPDKVHPNAEGAAIIAKTVAEAITAKEGE